MIQLKPIVCLYNFLINFKENNQKKNIYLMWNILTIILIQ